MKDKQYMKVTSRKHKRYTNDTAMKHRQCTIDTRIIHITNLEEKRHLTITQEHLIKQIAIRENMNTATVRRVFHAAEDILFDHLSSTTPSESTTIKLVDGLSLECTYIPERQIHTYDNIICKPRIWVKPKITRYYNRKLNRYFDGGRL
jgi:hypothetical protein